MATINPRFLDYLTTTFGWSPEETRVYAAVANRPLKKSLRINTSKISVADFQSLTQSRGWVFSASITAPNVWYVDRQDTTTPLGLTPEHLLGLFYIQETAASSSAWFLADEKNSKTSGLILDMSASPGGKTTQLSELFPNAFIVANDPARARLPQLFENLERMQCLNVGVTNYDARFFGRFPETFDRILLDAPCSGEGTAYKATGALEHWHIKNTKTISKLQEQLAFAASQALKTKGTLTYSTCTLNTLENEGVVDRVLEKCPYLSQVPVSGKLLTRRFWPHIHGTGGFFATKFRKTSASGHSDSAQLQPSTITHYSENIHNTIVQFYADNFGIDLSHLHFYGRNGEVCAVSQNIDALLAKFFFFRVGVAIGEWGEGGFVPNHAVGILFPAKKRVVEITPEQMNDYFAGRDILDIKTRLSAGWVSLVCGSLRLGIGLLDGKTIVNIFPKKLLHIAH